MKKWKCKICGYIYEGDEPPKKCPQCGAPEEKFVLIEDDAVDLSEIVREAVIFGAQMNDLCREDCRGLCPRCGKDLNEGPCDCEPEPDERFAALADLKFD